MLRRVILVCLSIAVCAFFASRLMKSTERMVEMFHTNPVAMIVSGIIFHAIVGLLIYKFVKGKRKN